MKLDLNWELESVEERREFASSYLEEHGDRLTPDNLNTIAEYVLWADLASNADACYELTTTRSPWKKERNDVSIDALYAESEETGKPVDLLLLGVKRQDRVRGRLERADVALRLGASSVLDLYERYLEGRLSGLHGTASQWVELWLNIDVLEFMVQTWELRRGKRKGDKPLRPELVEERMGLVALLRAQGVEDLRAELEEEVKEEAGYEVLKRKRTLVALRQQQYQLLDALPSIGRALSISGFAADPYREVKGFLPLEDPQLRFTHVLDSHFAPEFQGRVTRALRRMDLTEGRTTSSDLYPDLRDPNVVRALLERRSELAERLLTLPIEQREVMEGLLRYLQYYITRAALPPELTMVLHMKANGRTNREVRGALIEHFDLEYMENYISTIYTRRILQAIAREAEEHVRMLEYIAMGRNVFKVCVDCKRLLPRNNQFFSKRGSTSDGFLSYCKDCKVVRKEGRKNKQIKEVRE